MDALRWGREKPISRGLKPDLRAGGNVRAKARTYLRGNGGFLLGFLVCGCLSMTACALTLDRVRTAKKLVCGVNAEEGEYSRTDDHGTREAFDRDLCKAVAVAILGVGAKTEVKLFPDDVEAVAALKAGAVDLLPTTTLDFTHATERGVGFSGVVLWDGVGFMVPIASGARRVEELAGKKTCVLAETEVEETVKTWVRGSGVALNVFPFTEEGEMEAAFVTGTCPVLAGDLTRLASTRVGFGEIAGKFKILPGAVSKDPLAAAYLPGNDERFGRIVDWVVQVLVGAEGMGVTQARPVGNGVEWDLNERRLAGKTHDLGARLGLADDWAVRVLEAVGNYGEIYERDLGVRTEMGLERGWNRLARDGGLMVGLPLK
jgi:general L-amino acid transport system substrate-binding protein